MTNSVNFEDKQYTEMLGDFLDESDEILVVLNERLLTLDEWVSELAPAERGKCDADLLNDMFRAARSLKGMSAMLRLDDINVLTHNMENVFDAARNDQIEITPAVVESVFQAIDRLSSMIECLRTQSAEVIDASQATQQIQALLDANGATKEAASLEEDETLSPADGGAEPEAPAETAPIRYFDDVIDETDIVANYLAIFIDETIQSLDDVSELLLGTPEEVSVEQVMVYCHRIKGSAASIGLNRAAKLSHAMEDLLQDRIQAGETLTPKLCDALFTCADALRAYVDQLQNDSPGADDFETAFQTLKAARAELNDDSVDTPPSRPPRQQSSLTPEEISQICQRATNPNNTKIVEIWFEPDFPLVELKAKLVVDRASAAGEILHCVPPEGEFTNLEELELLTLIVESEHSNSFLQTNLDAQGVSKIAVCNASDRAGKAGIPAEPVVTEVVAEEASPEPEPAKPEVSVAVAADSKGVAKPEVPVAATAFDEVAAKPAAQRGKPAETLRVDIDRLDQLMNLAGQLVINKARFAQISDKLRQVSRVKGLASTIDDACLRLETMSKQGADAKATATLSEIAQQTEQIRGDLNSAVEQVNSLSQMRFLVNDLLEAVHQLDRVADGIQTSVMETRMVPIGPLFGRFKRVVRDLTRVNGKDVTLEINGEKTELDKRMIDELGDPLIHMVRNSVDHGIESPEDRRAAGKPAQGKVTLEAFHRGNRIIIQITDDGRGLPLDKILAKAVSQRLISEAEAEKMTPDQICELIWHPGLSTAEQVTEVSGRGMGMDIVRAKIEELSGTVDLKSTPGKGSTFTIRLPLTMAILPSLLAKIDGDVFAMPVESVVEIVRIKKSDLNTVQQQLTARVRNRIVSVVNLTDVFSWHNRPANGVLDSDDEEVTLVIMGADNVETGLVVHELIGEEDVVIKSLAENYRNIQGIAGASILGDGRVSLILDVAALIGMISAKQQRRAISSDTPSLELAKAFHP